MNNMSINAGSLVGPHHKKRGEENQDAYAYMQENGYTIISCADGAGSLSNSGIGASISAATSVEETLDSLLLGNTIEDALKSGIESARETIMQRDDWQDLGCTLSLAIATHDKWGVGLVGDSFAVVSKTPTDHLLLHREPDSEYSNITKLITSKDYDPMYVYGEGPITAISVASDGLTNLSVNIANREPAHNFWTPIISKTIDNDMNVQSFIEHLEHKEKLYDDTTLVIASTTSVNH